MVFSSEVCSTFTAMSSRTLLTDHVYFFENKKRARFASWKPVERFPVSNLVPLAVMAACI